MSFPVHSFVKNRKLQFRENMLGPRSYCTHSILQFPFCEESIRKFLYRVRMNPMEAGAIRNENSFGHQPTGDQENSDSGPKQCQDRYE